MSTYSGYFQVYVTLCLFVCVSKITYTTKKTEKLSANNTYHFNVFQVCASCSVSCMGSIFRSMPTIIKIQII